MYKVITSGKKYKYINNFQKMFIFIIVLLNSISGLQIKNVSVNMYLIFAFVLIVFYFFLKYNTNELKLPVKKTFILYMFFSIISCILSLLYTYKIPHENIVIKYAINSAVYLLIFLFLYNTKKELKNEFIDVFINALIWAARVQVIWGLMQVILVYVYRD